MCTFVIAKTCQMRRLQHWSLRGRRTSAVSMTSGNVMSDAERWIATEDRYPDERGSVRGRASCCPCSARFKSGMPFTVTRRNDAKPFFQVCRQQLRFPDIPHHRCKCRVWHGVSLDFKHLVCSLDELSTTILHEKVPSCPPSAFLCMIFCSCLDIYIFV